MSLFPCALFESELIIPNLRDFLVLAREFDNAFRNKKILKSVA